MYKYLEDLTGKRFGRLTAIKRVEIRNSKSYWLCRCDCGKEKVVESAHLTCNQTRSCGCLQVEASLETIKIAHLCQPARKFKCDDIV